LRLDQCGIQFDGRVELRAVVAVQRVPVGHGLVPLLTLRRERASLEVIDRRIVRAIMPARAPASIAMLHNVMRPSIDSARIVLPENSIE